MVFNIQMIRDVILSQAELGKTPQECVEYLKVLMQLYNVEFHSHEDNVVSIDIRKPVF